MIANRQCGHTGFSVACLGFVFVRRRLEVFRVISSSSRKASINSQTGMTDNFRKLAMTSLIFQTTEAIDIL